MDDAAGKELKEQLSQGPFPRGGFDDRLRRRILDRIDEKGGRSGRSRRFVWRSSAAALAAFAVALLGLGAWLWNGLPGGHNEQALSEPTPAAFAASPPAAATAVRPTRYAVLIGLRADTSAGSIPTGEYRTVLIAPRQEPGKLGLAADIPGLYMPYGQNFWRISAVSLAGGRQALRAVQVTGRKNGSAVPAVTIPDDLLSERVLYAGNEYLSIQSTIKDGQGATLENHWVKSIVQLNAVRKTAASEPHVALRELADNSDPALRKQEQWSIVRIPGKWVPQTGAGDVLSLALPERVIQNDRLTLSWEQIGRIEPGARDAFTYGDLLGVVASGEIRVRAVSGGVSASDPVRVPLKKGESLVMIQWAQDNYVDRWIADMRSMEE